MVNNEGKEPPSEFLKKMDYLRRLISKYEDKGVNVRRAWYLFNRARDLSHKPEEALDLVARARGDLSYKRKLFRWSTGWSACLFGGIAVSVIVLIPVSLWLICDYLVPCLPGVSIGTVVLGIPVFLLKWGYIGAAAYVLFSIGKKIASRLLDPHEAPAYLFRLFLGCVFAAVLFYVFQLGFLSLPGYAGEEVNAALERAGNMEKYQKDYSEMKRLIPEVDDYKKILDDFERVEKEDVVAKAALLLNYEDKWSKSEYEIKVEVGNEVVVGSGTGRSKKPATEPSELKEAETVKEEKPLTSVMIEKALLDYETSESRMNDNGANIDEYFNAAREVVKKREDIDENVKRRFDEEYESPKEKAEMMFFIMSLLDDKGVPPLEVETEVNLKEQKEAFETNEVKVNETGNKIERYFSVVKERYIAKELRPDYEDADEKLAEVKERVNKWRCYIESVELEEKIKPFDENITKLTGKIEAKEELMEITNTRIDEIRNKPEYKGTKKYERDPEYAEKVGERQTLNREISKFKNELAKAKEERKPIYDELRAAYRREAGKPIWESAFFIVLAFFAGFSVNFVNKIFDRAMRGILDIKSSAEEPKGEAGMAGEPPA